MPYNAKSRITMSSWTTSDQAAWDRTSARCKLRVPQIERMAVDGDHKAGQVISMHRMACKVPNDVAARVFFVHAFEEWEIANPEAKKTR